jgi:hypothetical protein
MNAGQSSDELDPVAAQAAIDYCYAQGWSDGLPVVPPTESVVGEFIARGGGDPELILSNAEHLDRSCSVWQAAVNAVMAGCLPEYFPIVLGAIDALFGDPEVGWPAEMVSTSGPAPMVVVNGPIRRRVGLNCSGSLFSPGFRANATIARALRLIALNVFGLQPHVLEQATQGTPCKWSMCFGENEEDSPWQPLHVELGFPADSSTVTAVICHGTMDVGLRHTRQPERVLLSLANAMSSVNPGYYSSRIALVMGPEHAHLLHDAGWSKQRVRQFLWEHYGEPLGSLRRYGRGEPESSLLSERAGTYVLVEQARRERRMPGSEHLPDDHFIHFAESADAILLVVAGANNAGVSTIVALSALPGLANHGKPVTLPISGRS